MRIVKLIRESVHLNNIFFLAIMVLLIISSTQTIGYKQDEDTGEQVHQYITSEAIEVWTGLPSEIRENADNSINTDTNDEEYQEENNDDIIDGSGEEDVGPEALPFLRHFWEADNPENEEYNDGLFGFESSYRRSERYWRNNLMRFYIDEADKAQAYYWLGRVAHLLEDATVPAHAHLDAHPGNFLGIDNDDTLEEFTVLFNRYQNGVQNYRYFDGNNYAGKQYNIQNITLPSNVKTNPSDLFKLFWYTAQKTQYFASDDENGSTIYRELDDTQRNHNPSLWLGESVTIVNNSADLTDDDINDEGQDVANIASAMLPHAMKAVAGLYKLFWEIINKEHTPGIKENIALDAQNQIWVKKLNISGSIGRYEAKLTVPANADFDIQLFQHDEQGNSMILAQGTNGVGQDEKIKTLIIHSGTYYLVVERISGNGTATLIDINFNKKGDVL